MAFHSSFRGSPPRTPPVFINPQPPPGTTSTAYSFQFLAGAALRYALASGPLPPGITLNTATGVVSGTLTSTVANYNVTISATNVFGTVTTSQTIQVGNPPTFTQSSPPDGTVGVAYSYQFIATGTGTMQYAVASGALPAGLSLDANTGIVSGTPTTVATYNYAIRATNLFGSATTSTKTVNVVAGSTGPVSDAQWTEIATQAAAWGDPNNPKARVDAIPTTGTNLAAGGNIQTALNGVGAGGAVLLGTGTFTPTGSLLTIASGRKLVAAPGASPVIDLSQLTNFACIYLGNGSVFAGIECKNARGISIITFDTVAGQYSNGGTTGLIYNSKIHDSGLTGSETDGTGISITGGDDTSRGQNWCDVANEVYNCWNPGGSPPTGNGGNSDGIGSHFGSGQTTHIAVNSHNNGDDSIDMWNSGATYHYFGNYHDSGKVPGVTNGGDGNGVKLGTGNVSHKFYKTFSTNNRAGGFNLNGNVQQPTGILSGASGNAGGDFINGCNPF